MPVTAVHVYRATAASPAKPLLLYLPGMDGTGQLFYRQSPTLTPYFEIGCLGLPPQARWGWTELTQQALSSLQAELAPQKRPIWLCGESFGACLALNMAITAPQLIRRLILINPASCFYQQSSLHMAASLVDYFPDWLQRQACWGLLPLLAELNRVRAGDRRALIAAMQSVPAATVSKRLELLSQFTASVAQLRQVSQPTLLIAGARDRLLPSVTEAHRLAQVLPDARIAIRPESGHACLLEYDWRLSEVLAARNFLPTPTVSTTASTLA
ncbi:MAG: alpha/beta hydrolase [Spirulinaceae cyanobacterium RM2_2_10]|nr:alpha/beta hydrolase [Spirulinaceae cyanobacterium SM2_1_0]NJO19654.1 alpha/beta hydrolase [Spirulinaceae cyanobacterium RM2_2_10]